MTTERLVKVMKRLLLMTAAAFAVLVWAPVAGAWTWPADGALLQPFVFDRTHPYAAGQHRGIDVAGASGSDVRAPAGGAVSFAGSVPSSGKSVTIQTTDGYSVTLTHLGTIGVARGATVTEGASVGSIGPSGDVEWPEPYVHMGVRITADAQGYVDPLAFLPPRAVPEASPAPPPEATGQPADVVPAPPPIVTDAPPSDPVGAAPPPAVALEPPVSESSAVTPALLDPVTDDPAAVGIQIPATAEVGLSRQESAPGGDPLPVEADPSVSGPGTAPAVTSGDPAEGPQPSSSEAPASSEDTAPVDVPPVSGPSEPAASDPGAEPVASVEDPAPAPDTTVSAEAPAPDDFPSSAPGDVGQPEASPVEPAAEVDPATAEPSAEAPASDDASAPVSESVSEPIADASTVGAESPAPDQVLTDTALPSLPAPAPPAVIADPPLPPTASGAGVMGPSVDSGAAPGPTPVEAPAAPVVPPEATDPPSPEPVSDAPPVATATPAPIAETVDLPLAASKPVPPAGAIGSPAGEARPVSRPSLAATPGPATKAADSPSGRHSSPTTGFGPGARPPRVERDDTDSHAARHEPAHTRASSAAIARGARSHTHLRPGGSASHHGGGRTHTASGLIPIALGAGLALLAFLGGGLLFAGRRLDPPSPASPVEAAMEAVDDRAGVEQEPRFPEALRWKDAPLVRAAPRANSRRSCMALRGRAPSHRPCGGLRSVGRLRPLSPTARERRADGLGDGRAWDARDGYRGRRRAVAA